MAKYSERPEWVIEIFENLPAHKTNMRKAMKLFKKHPYFKVVDGQVFLRAPMPTLMPFPVWKQGGRR